ncbi:hypothetical protein BDZ94DRAFT_1303209 [Collybia nuda]|uniref:DUF6534 domain-containing protein n=1 Tax=Collybia nuda TaxID=64659 RepID=A0A9P5YIG2_9AGAR|nr:hypothetical protein BDZ94DRAFT_1303209 [Collybia nuda]
MAVFDLILGPILMGTMMNILLFGIMIVQCYLYYERYKRDRLIIKSVVVLLLFLDALSSCFAMIMSYDYFVTNFGNIPAITVTNIGVDPYPLLTGVTAFVVQSFFAWRIHILIRSRALSILIVVLSAVQMLASIGAVIGGVMVKEFAKFVHLKQVSLVWLLGSVVTDAIITVSLVSFLKNARTGFRSTDHLTSRIIRFTVQTGLLTTMFAVASSLLHLAFGLPLSKLYTNSLLSSLNSRAVWSNEGYTSKSGVCFHHSDPEHIDVDTSSNGVSVMIRREALTVNGSSGGDIGTENHEIKVLNLSTSPSV